MRVLRAWLERYLLDDFQDGENHKLLRDLHELAKLHDDVTNENDISTTLKKNLNKPVSPVQARKNGNIGGIGFADFVAAKLAVATKTAKNSQG